MARPPIGKNMPDEMHFVLTREKQRWHTIEV